MSVCPDLSSTPVGPTRVAIKCRTLQIPTQKFMFLIEKKVVIPDF